MNIFPTPLLPYSSTPLLPPFPTILLNNKYSTGHDISQLFKIGDRIKKGKVKYDRKFLVLSFPLLRG